MSVNDGLDYRGRAIAAARLSRPVLMPFVIAGGLVGLVGCGWLNDGSDPSGGGNGDGVGIRGVATLQISNPVPAINEEVIFRCASTGTDPATTTFAYQPATDRLFVDATTGIGRFVVTESDIGVAYTFTCTARTPSGSTEPSAPQTFIAN